MKLTSTVMSFPAWVTATGDVNSTETPTGITSAAAVLYINPTKQDTTIALSGLYIDARGVEYNNSVTIKPFQSALLFKADHEIQVRLGSYKIRGWRQN
jgi:lipopolysaccharide export system protein LptA